MNSKSFLINCPAASSGICNTVKGYWTRYKNRGMNPLVGFNHFSLFIAFFLAFEMCAPPLLVALPSEGTVQTGTVTISQPVPEQLVIRQTTNKAIIDWRNFDIQANEHVDFQLPSAEGITLNRVTGGESTNIFGRLTSNGNLMLINPSGILFGAGSKVDVNGLVATTVDIDNENFMAGRYIFDKPSSSSGFITNAGEITVAEGGMLAFVAPGVENSGVISANLGRVNLSSGTMFTLDFYGDNLVTLGVDAEVLEKVVGPDGTPLNSLVNNTGTIKADGGRIFLQVNAAKDIVDHVINMSGVVEAKTAHVENGEIILEGGDGEVSITGTLDVSGINAGESGGRIIVDAASVTLGEGEILATGNEAVGGDIVVKGSDWVGLGGDIDASGETGGTVTVNAGGLSLASEIRATGTTNKGGSITLTTETKSWENTAASLDVSGAEGGTITHIADQQITTSASYTAIGTNGLGGNIDVTAPALKFLSGQIDASGESGGGQIRLGGEYQGGKNLEGDELENAQILSMTDTAQIKADTLGEHGDGGTIISWSDQVGAVLGNFFARPGSQTGNGGFVEVSSGDSLTFGGQAITGLGERLGTFLLDPKNITIADPAGYNQSAIVIGIGYDSLNIGSQSLDGDDRFGSAVSLDGNRLAVGARLGEGMENGNSDSGEVYLYSFSDSFFSGGTLEAIIGDGYTGGKNINQALDGNDGFGSAVSLNGNGLAVGARLGDGTGNSKGESGEIYLYSFSDSFFSGGTLEVTIGDGYSGGKNFDQTLDAGDRFGSAVSLDGNRLAVGAREADGSSNSTGESGEIYLYSFSDSFFSGGTLEATIGDGYSGGKNIDQTLDGDDRFGGSVSLDGNRLAVGARKGDGFVNGNGNSGEVYLYSFSDSFFSGGTLEATIGDGYSGGKNIDQTLDGNDEFGFSVSLEGNGLAVGSRLGDGLGNAVSNSGEVYLYSFSDSFFSGGTMEATIGDGYSGGKNIDQTLDGGDQFGFSVSLDGNRLSAGAEVGDGFENINSDSGEVYLYTFNDSDFNSGGDSVAEGDFGIRTNQGLTITPGTLASLLSSPQDVTLQANNDITIANAVAVNNSSGDGGNLTLQAGRSILINSNISTDNGDLTITANETLANGVVDTQRDSGSAVVAMGDATTLNAGSGNVSITLAAGTGKSNTTSGDITLNTVITTGNLTVDNSGPTAGSDILQTGALAIGGTANFTTGTFNSSITLGDTENVITGAISFSTTGTGNVTLDNGTTGTNLGTVSVGGDLSVTGGNTITDSGALTVGGISSFTTDVADRSITLDTTTNALAGAISFRTTGTGNVTLDNGATATNLGAVHVGRNLAVTAGNSITDSGVLTVDGASSFTTDVANQSITLDSTRNALAGAISFSTTGTGDVILDNGNIATNLGTVSLGGNLSMTAGNAITDSGVLTVGGTSNFTTDIANRSITLDTPTNVLTGAVSFSTNGTGHAILTNNTTTTLNASTIGDSLIVDAIGSSSSINVNGALNAHSMLLIADNDIVLNSGTLTASGSGNSLILASTKDGNFINNVGAGVLETSSGRWLIYSTNPANDTLGGLTPDKKRYNTTYPTIPDNFLAKNNGLIYSVAPTLTITVDNKDRFYGYGNPPLTFASSGFIDGDTVGTALTGSITTAAVSTSNVGAYLITQGTVADLLGYTINFTNGTLTLAARPITLAAVAGQSKVYGAADPGFTETITSGSVAFTNTLTGAQTRAAGEDVGSYALAQGTLTVSDDNGGANYDITYISENFDITQRLITITADAGQNKIYGASDPAFTETITSGSLIGADTLTGAQSRAVVEDVGRYALNQGTLTVSDGNDGANYSVTYISDNFDISQRPVTITADASQSKIYGEEDPTFTESITSGALQFTDTLTGTQSRAVGEDVGSYVLAQGTLTVSDGNAGANYAFTYVSDNFDISQRPITITADAGQSKEFGATDPSFTSTITSGVLAFTDSLTGDLSRVAGENIGSYEINQGTLAVNDGNSGNNYNLTYIRDNFTITDQSITTAPDVDKIIESFDSSNDLNFPNSNSGLSTNKQGIEMEDLEAMDIEDLMQTRVQVPDNIGSNQQRVEMEKLIVMDIEDLMQTRVQVADNIRGNQQRVEMEKLIAMDIEDLMQTRVQVADNIRGNQQRVEMEKLIAMDIEDLMQTRVQLTGNTEFDEQRLEMGKLIMMSIEDLMRVRVRHNESIIKNFSIVETRPTTEDGETNSMDFLIMDFCIEEPDQRETISSYVF